MENLGDEWHRAMSKRIGRAIMVRRLELGMTAQQLAERCKELGAPIHRTTITKVENGRPRFDLGELIVIAAALSTSPTTLLFRGPSYRKAVDMLPGFEVTRFLAAQWFSALSPADDATASAWAEDTRHLNLYRELDELQRLRHTALAAAVDDDDMRPVAFYDKQIRRVQLDMAADIQQSLERLRPAVERGNQAAEEAAQHVRCAAEDV